MATTNFSSLVNPSNILSFNTATDTLVFDSPSISAARLLIRSDLITGTTFSYEGKSVTLSGIFSLALSPANVVFADGSLLLFGDQTNGMTNDFLGQTFTGGAGNDAMLGLSGVDTMAGEAGNDLFYLVSVPSPSADNVDGGSGDDRVIFLGANTNTGALAPTTSNVSVNLESGTATWGSASVQLNSIEDIQVVGANGTTHVLTGNAEDNSFVIGGASGTSTASYTVDGGDGIDYLGFNLNNTTPVTVSLANASVTWGSSQIAFSHIEALSGTAGNDALTGDAGNNSFVGRAGNDSIDGGGATDTANFSGSLVNYTLTGSGGSYTVRANSGSDGTDTLSNIEALKFADKTVNLTIQAIAAAAPQADVQQVEELYVAFFNRVPDADGLAYWLGQMSAGQSINQIAEAFYSAGIQYSSLTGFSSGMSNADFVNVVYRNVLGRSDGADAGGLAYWTEELASGQATHGSLVSTILSSAHTYKGDATWGWVPDLLDNKISVANQFAVTWGLNYNTPDESIARGMAIASAVTPTDTAAAIALIGVLASDMNLG